MKFVKLLIQQFAILLQRSVVVTTIDAVNDTPTPINGTPGGTSQYGYKLLGNFDDLWVASNKFHSENILECSHSSAGNSDWGWWGQGNDEGNTLNVMVGPRSYSLPAGSLAPDLPSGWSFNVFTQDFYNVMKGDPRFHATIFVAAQLLGISTRTIYRKIDGVIDE